MSGSFPSRTRPRPGVFLSVEWGLVAPRQGRPLQTQLLSPASGVVSAPGGVVTWGVTYTGALPVADVEWVITLHPSVGGPTLAALGGTIPLSGSMVLPVSYLAGGETYAAVHAAPAGYPGEEVTDWYRLERLLEGTWGVVVSPVGGVTVPSVRVEEIPAVVALKAFSSGKLVVLPSAGRAEAEGRRLDPHAVN